MTEQDFKKIEELFQRQAGVFDEKLAHQAHVSDLKLEGRLAALSDDFDRKLQQHLGMVSEDFEDKLELLAEGQQMLAEKLDATRVELKEEIRKVDHRLTVVEARLTTKLETLETKVDGIKADLSAHIADPAPHSRTGYLVREEG